MMALALASLAGGGLPALSRRDDPDDDPEPEDWNERRAWLERMDARAYGEPVPGERHSRPRPLPPAELKRWQAAEAKRARKAAKRRGS